MLYSILVTLHIVFAGMWLFGIPLDFFLRKKIKADSSPDPKIVKLYLAQLNFTGIIASVGILATGIYLVASAMHFSFFDFTANHWLVSKQVLIIVILGIIGGMMVPAAKRTRLALHGDPYNNSEVSYNLKKVFRASTIVNLLVLLNFLFALSRNFS